MVSTPDKIILSSMAAVITAVTGSASAFAWKMMNVDGRSASSVPGALVAELSAADGEVMTRHRETLGWTGGEVAQKLREGDRIRTLSRARATVRYAQGLEVVLEPDSQITVHGPSDSKGEQLIASIDVVDGSIRARVQEGRTVALNGANGEQKGRLRASEGQAELTLKAPEQADGAIDVKLESGTKVAVASGIDLMPALPGATPKPGETPVPNEHPSAVAWLGAGETRQLGAVKTLPTPTLAFHPVATPIPPLEPGELPDILSEGGDLRFRRPIPRGVVFVQVKGQPAVIHNDGTFEVVLYGVPIGRNTVDLEYRHADGTWTRQVQQIRVRAP